MDLDGIFLCQFEVALCVNFLRLYKLLSTCLLLILREFSLSTPKGTRLSKGRKKLRRINLFFKGSKNGNGKIHYTSHPFCKKTNYPIGSWKEIEKFLLLAWRDFDCIIFSLFINFSFREKNSFDMRIELS